MFMDKQPIANIIVWWANCLYGVYLK